MYLDRNTLFMDDDFCFYYDGNKILFNYSVEPNDRGIIYQIVIDDFNSAKKYCPRAFKIRYEEKLDKYYFQNPDTANVKDFEMREAALKQVLMRRNGPYYDEKVNRGNDPEEYYDNIITEYP